MDYIVWTTSPFDNDRLVDKVAMFISKELAIDFIEYQLTLGNIYGLTYNGIQINLNDEFLNR